MKVALQTSTTIAAVFLASIAAAQNTDGVRFEDDRPVNRFGLSYRAGFNVSAKFKNAGVGANPGPARSGVNHNYDNGYNRVDVSGNTGQGACENCTWYWGYERSSQVSPDGLFLSMSSSSAEAEVDADEDVSHGAELTYQRELGRIGRAYWGVEGAFNYMTLDISEDVSLTRITDRYALTVEGVTIVPPLPPYAGSFQGPGPVISDIPLRRTERLPGGEREFEADIYGFKIGPYIEWPFAEKWSLLFSGGLAIASINSDFGFTDARTGASGSDSDSDWNFGGYVSGNIIYNITRSVDIFAGVQYQHLGDYSHKLDGTEAELDLGQSVYGVVGVGFSF
jgi:opacity protein-like surface antigen